MDNNTAKAREVAFDKEEVLSMSPGFHKESQWLPYCCFEDVFNPLGDFINNSIHGEQFDKDTQLETFKVINASPEGDCGEKALKTIMERI